MKLFELNRDFLRKTVVLTLPVILQSLITIGINFMDNLMVGSFGETQIAAASFGNQFYGLFQFICMGLGSGAIVMSSQFWGRGELEPMRVAAAIALRVTTVLCALFTLFSVAFPRLILRIFTNDAAVVAVGTPYLRLIGTTFLLTGLTSTATYLLRSVSSVKIPMVGSLIAFVLNIFFNWVFIFGKFGAPRLEIVGAAVGTVIARVAEFCFICGYFVLRDDKFRFRMRHFLLSGRSLRSQYVKYSVPVLISDFLLGLSLSLTSVIYGHVGAEITAANAIVNSFVQVLTVFNNGISGASAVVIGNTIGEGAVARAKREGNSYVLLAALIGLAGIPILLLLERPYGGLYAIGAVTRAMTHSMFVLNCWMMPFMTMAFMTSKGILRGGGDTRFLLLADSSCVWFISLPLGALAGLVWGMSPAWVYFFLRVEYPLKGLVCLVRYFSGRWIRVIRAGERENA
jgi:putative MATE family efflux protein